MFGFVCISIGNETIQVLFRNIDLVIETGGICVENMQREVEVWEIEIIDRICDRLFDIIDLFIQIFGGT